VLRLFLLLCVTAGVWSADLVEIMPGLRLAIPAAWTSEWTPDRRTRVWRHPQENGVAVAVQVQTAEDQRDATALLDEALALLARLGHDVVILQPIAAATDLGPGWQRARYRFRTGPTAWEQEALLLRNGNSLVAITLSMPSGSRERWQGAFSAILASLARSPSRLGP